jgi:hypothetical protein
MSPKMHRVQTLDFSFLQYRARVKVGSEWRQEPMSPEAKVSKSPIAQGPKCLRA